MTLRQFFELFAKYVWPAVLAWNVFLYQHVQATQMAIYEDRLTIAREYTSKKDLEKMFDDLENRIDKRLSEMISLCKPK